MIFGTSLGASAFSTIQTGIQKAVEAATAQTAKAVKAATIPPPPPTPGTATTTAHPTVTAFQNFLRSKLAAATAVATSATATDAEKLAACQSALGAVATAFAALDDDTKVLARPSMVDFTAAITKLTPTTPTAATLLPTGITGFFSTYTTASILVGGAAIAGLAWYWMSYRKKR